jgi:inosose dehydratase
MAIETLTGTKTRREVLQALGALGVSGSLTQFGMPGAFAQTRHTPPGIHFGVQLNAFPINPRNFQSFLDVLAEVKQVGYQGFESSFRNVSQEFADPAPARRSIEQTGLTFFGIHIYFPDEMYDKNTLIASPAVYEPVGRGGAALGAKHLILSGAPAANPGQLKAKIEGLNAAGRFAQSVGLTAAYHNEKGPMEELEALYAQADPSLVYFLLDAGHAYNSGANVSAFVRAHFKRIIGFHLRDYRNGHPVTLGTGTFPLAELAANIEQLGWKGWVEYEEERGTIDKSMPTLKLIEPAYKAMTEAFSS